MLSAIDQADSRQQTRIADIWTAACGNCFTVSKEFVAYNLDVAPEVNQEGRFVANADGQPVGFILASHLETRTRDFAPAQGWLDAIAVLPEFQERGNGSELLQWGETWLAAQGCETVTLGAGIRTFTPGLPPDTLSVPFFDKRGYRVADNSSGLVWDVAADLAEYDSPRTVHDIDGVVRPASPGDEKQLLDFLEKEFPGRWLFETLDFLARGGRISDYMLLWTDRGVEGYCWLTFEDSPRPMERYYPYGLPRPWGQLGPIGVSESARGHGYGAAVLDAGLRRLRDNGVRGCVIDWTSLLDFYGKFGFTQYREYLQLSKRLA
jgi:GNAT superfamily N-acetyltransferase